MGLVNTDNFTAKQNEIATIAKAMGHPARVAIIQQLLQENSCNCGDLVDKIPLSQPTISRHLKELKSIAVIKGTIEGTSVNYCINGKKWRTIKSLFNELFDTYAPDLDCSC